MPVGLKVVKLNESVSNEGDINNMSCAMWRCSKSGINKDFIEIHQSSSD